MAVGPEPKLPPEAMPWARYEDDRIASLERELAFVKQDSDNTFKQLNNSITVLGQQILALPVTNTINNTTTGWSLNSTYTGKVAISFTVPDKKNFAVVSVNGNAAALDTATGGVTSAYGRINFGGLLSPEFAGSKDTGSSAVNNIVNVGYSYSVTVTAGSTYAINFELKGLNPTAFTAQAQNYAFINVFITYTRR